MNLRDLHYVVLLAELRHFGKAAEAANVSQPTLSAQIKKLEDELGVALFERDSRNVAPTAAGMAVVAEAKLALAHVDAIKDAAGEYKDPLAGNLRVGVIASLSPFLVPDLLEKLGFDAPRMTVLVEEGLTENLMVKLLDRGLDAVIVASDVGGDGLTSTPLFDEPFLIAHAPEHALAKRKKIRLEDVGAGNLMLLDEGHCLRDQVLGLCMLDSVDPRVKATSLTTLMRLVAMNRGVTLVPQLAASEGKGLVLRKVEDAEAYRSVQLVSRRNFVRAGALDVVAQAARAVARAAMA